MTANNTPPFGTGDSSFQAAGGIDGIRQLVEAFYEAMDEPGEAALVRQMYPADLAPAKDKLASFLCGWLGGPRLYAERFGSINIPQFHRAWSIGSAESEAWLACMAKAIARQGYPQFFADYLLLQLRVPATRIQQASAQQRGCPLRH